MKSFSKNRKLECYYYFEPIQQLKKATVLTFFLFFTLFTGTAQHVPTIVSEDNATMRALCERVLPHGWLFFKEDAGLDSTALFRDYYDATGLSTNDEMRIERDYIDDLGYHFTRYQQFHKGIEVEMAEFLTISEDGRMQVARGSLAENLDINTLLTIPKVAAVMTAINSVDADVFSWEVPEIEEAIKETTGDPLATTFPDGELKIAFLGDKELTANHYRLAWKIKVSTVEPYDYLEVYIDALNGELLKTNSKLIKACNMRTGTVNPTLYHGNKSFSTQRVNGPFDYDYRLVDCSRGNGIIVKNRDGNGGGNHVFFDDAPHLIDDNNVWGGNREAATTLWMMQEIWDYFDDIHNLNGADDSGKEVRIFAHS